MDKQENLTTPEPVGSVNPDILLPQNPQVLVQEDASQGIAPTQTILTEPGPAITQASQPGPSMYEQLQMANNSTSLQPRLNIRAPLLMTDTAFMPSFSSRPSIPIPRNIFKEARQQYVNLSAWPSCHSDGDRRNM
ncbi:hypothetical protein Salat_1086000 [Sesamum alatum]|uniref:Uncharacterized protein n=1 Tax=Sesamum alatum TaxID=300844 RepID=A0AAE1YNG5_9LAMI|nr:hypothetical protein Salat_1086000 [Sesamum alatum]